MSVEVASVCWTSDAVYCCKKRLQGWVQLRHKTLQRIAWGEDHKHYAHIKYQVRRIWDCAIANRVGRRVTCCAARPGHSDHVVLADISGD